MLASPLLSSFLVSQRFLWDIMSYASSLVFLFFDSLFKFISSPLEEGSRISNEGHSPIIYSFNEVSAGEFCLE